jgi:SAM-dependent methyltransferase
MISLEKALEEMGERGRFAQERILVERPDLLDLFFTYQNEALEARRLLDSSLVKLEGGARILEIGGGILALASQLASEGFKVTSVEPVGAGFNGISFIMRIFSEITRNENVLFELIDLPIEDCEFDNDFDFIFSVNVMEHLEDPYSVILHVLNNLELAGEYRFICPNYDFPYEPHFGKLLYRRKSGSFILSKDRASHHTYQDSEGLFDSINWITAKKVREFSKEHNFKIKFNRYALRELLIRAYDDEFIRKRHPIFASLLRPIALLRIFHLAALFPPEIQPTMDVSLKKEN